MQKLTLKNLFALLLVLTGSAYFSSCSSDDDAGPSDLGNVEPVIFERAEDITVPEAMQQLSDVNAQEVNANVIALSGFSGFSALFVAPQGVQPDRVNDPITGTNQRVAEFIRSETYLFDDGSGFAVAYQIGETDDSFIFEYFLSVDGGATFLLFYRAEQTKDGNSASFEVYDLDEGNIVFLYEFDVNADDSITVSLVVFDDFGIAEDRITANFNPDGSGDLDVFEDGNLIYTAEWDGAGNGSFTEFDSAGNIIDSGSWMVS